MLAVIRQSSCVSSGEAMQVAGQGYLQRLRFAKWFVKGVQYGIRTVRFHPESGGAERNILLGIEMRVL
jgi:hypothetical protein